MAVVRLRRPSEAVAASVSTSPSDFRSNESNAFFTLSVLMLMLLLCISALATYLYFRVDPSASVSPSAAATIMSASAPSAALFEAVSTENLEAVNAALTKGDNPNAFNAGGQAALHVIATKSFRNANTCQ